MAAIDAIISAVVSRIKAEGLLEQSVFMGTVSAVTSGGTVTVTRAGDTYPRVRRLASYTSPSVGDRVEIMRTAGGWICLGKLA
ncbi:hypothetical protein [Streptomyces sp. NPDC007063]|uniref:hypothetical protein n=1 Tax=Streptomyces sp. NPDC007063 TaxID=3364772 RepID=UPI0036D082EB